MKSDPDLKKDEVRSFGMHYQSTLIVFKDGREVGRSTADQNPVRIADLLHLSL